MVMPPAQGGEVVGVVAATVGAVLEVVGLEPVPGPTSVDGAPTVSGEDEATESGWDRRRSVPHGEGGAISCEGYDFDGAVTQHFFQCADTDPGSTHHRYPGFTVGDSSLSGVTHDGHHRPCARIRSLR
jgi:hypothetical protein